MPKLRSLVSILLATVLPTIASAASTPWDSSVTVNGRLGPFGGSFVGNLGYTQILWSENQDVPFGAQNWKYGYIRPNAYVSTSGWVNEGNAELEIFPISVLGLKVGRTESLITRDFSNFDCITHHCRGLLNRTYGTVQGMAGWKRLFAVASVRGELLGFSKADRPFADSTNVITGAAGGDSMITSSALLGAEITDAFKAGVLAFQSTTDKSQETARHLGIFSQYTYKNWTYFGGVGTFESNVHGKSPQILLQAKWIPDIFGK